MSPVTFSDDEFHIEWVPMVDIEEVAQRIVKAERAGRRLTMKTIFKLCGYDRGVMREVFRRVQTLREKKDTLTNWIE